MKLLLLLVLAFTNCLHITYAQNNDWFKGTWYGERTFPESHIIIKVLLRMEIDAVYDSSFTGRLIYMYPSDTAARLISAISGELYDKHVMIVMSEETYRMDPRSRSFWSDCSQCPDTSSFYVEGNNLVMHFAVSACGDSCNGETVFRRKIQDYDKSMQVAVVKKFSADKAPVSFAAYTMDGVDTTMNAIDTSGNPSIARRDSLKYFPSLLNDNMRVKFDPNKYKLPAASSIDTALTPKQQAALNTMAKSTAAPKNVTVNDSGMVNNKNFNSAAATVQTSAKNNSNAGANDSAMVSKKNNPVAATATQHTGYANFFKKDTAHTPNKTQVNTAVSQVPRLPTNTGATVAAPVSDKNPALPTPAKDTVPAAIIQRTTSLVTSYQVSSPHIAVQLLDDGQIDGDAVSVYYNGKVIINNQTLTHKAIVFTLEASAANRHHEFILISESEGFLPPNTALMRIRAGSQQFELNVSSSSARNAKIAIDYTGE